MINKGISLGSRLVVMFLLTADSLPFRLHRHLSNLCELVYNGDIHKYQHEAN